MPRVFFTTLAMLLTLSQARAQISGDVVKIGIITDLSGIYSANTGVGTVEATKMAVEDFGGTYKVLAQIPAAESIRPLAQSECPMVKKN